MCPSIHPEAELGGEEMAIEAECIPDALPPHQRKGDAIGERKGLIGELAHEAQGGRQTMASAQRAGSKGAGAKRVAPTAQNRQQRDPLEFSNTL